MIARKSSARRKGPTSGRRTCPRPVLCPGCPHRGIFYVLGKLKLAVSGVSAAIPWGRAALSAMDTTICMGASVSALTG
jgi:indolepyruvate ferredoxin oxidoreductase alpha subunit